jgi:hypothetical protein
VAVAEIPCVQADQPSERVVLAARRYPSVSARASAASKSKELPSRSIAREKYEKTLVE